MTPKSIKQQIFKDYQTKSNFSSWFGRVFFGIENNTLETNENIFSVVSRLANSVSSLPFKLYQKYDPQTNSFTEKLMNFPNPNYSLDEIFRILEVARNTNGNGYALIMRDIRMKVEMLVPINPSHCEPVMDIENHELWYRVTNQGKSYFIHNSDMIHVKHIAGNGNYKGISPIGVLKNSNDFDKAVREFSLKEMQNVRDSFILKYEQNVDPEKRQAIIDDFRRFYEDNGGILFQEAGTSIEYLDRKFIPSEIQITEEITRDRIANVYNVPAIFLNASSDSFSSNEQLMQLFVNLTLLPILRQYEMQFNKKILSSEERKKGFYFKFNVNGLLRGDSEARANFYSKGLRDGWLTRDDVRAWEELPPKGGKASDLWISGDMYPLEMDPALRKTNTSKSESGES